MVVVPSFALAEEVNKMLSFHGNLASDGRPILGISCYKLAEELFRISDDIMLIPAHVWTPWFSVFGSNSGFNSLEEAFDIMIDTDDIIDLSSYEKGKDILNKYEVIL